MLQSVRTSTSRAHEIGSQMHTVIVFDAAALGSLVVVAEIVVVAVHVVVVVVVVVVAIASSVQFFPSSVGE